jgi:predicted PurR-regulated permease PerM
MFGSAFGVGLGGCLGIIAAIVVVFFLIAFCTAAMGGGGGKNKGASPARDSVELAYSPNYR